MKTLSIARVASKFEQQLKHVLLAYCIQQWVGLPLLTINYHLSQCIQQQLKKYGSKLLKIVGLSNFLCHKI